MHFGPVKLIFEKIVDIKPGGELVPFYHFKIIDKEGAKVGHINFKIGDTNHITQYVGHIGYEILPEYRGNSYSYFACNAIRPFIRKFYDKVILTSDPKNIPSIKTIEKLNAEFLNEVMVPKQDPSYKSGSTRKKRYEWEPYKTRRSEALFRPTKVKILSYWRMPVSISNILALLNMDSGLHQNDGIKAR